jgi:hypothetical protein
MRKLFNLTGLASLLAVISLIPTGTSVAAVCLCDWTFPVVTISYTGTGETCQEAQAHLDAQILAYATSFCNPEYQVCSTYTVIEENCFYNPSLRKFQMKGHGLFVCREC